jgi:hypothetical protein
MQRSSGMDRFPAFFVDFLVVRRLGEIPPGPEVEQVRRIEGPKIGGQLPMEGFGRGTFQVWDDRSPFRGMIETHAGRNVDVPFDRPPLRQNGADFLRERHGELPVGIHLETKFKRGVGPHGKPMSRANDKVTSKLGAQSVTNTPLAPKQRPTSSAR